MNAKLRFYDICVLMIVALVASGVHAQQQMIIPAPPQLSAKAYILMDADTGKILVQHNSDLPLPPASLTKMMTSYIVSEEIATGRLKEGDLVQISDNAWRRGGSASGSSTMFLKPRTKVSVIDLLRGVIVQSGNDASIALAEHLAGSESAFADVMNQQAQRLGMTSSSFVNSTGWPAEGHITTAYDLAQLAKALVNNHPKHYAIYSEKYFKYNGINQPNRNRLLFTDRFVDGIKTGHTREAGYCLVSSSKRDGMRLVSVVMGTKSEKTRASESQSLLAYGFRYFKTLNLYNAGDTINTTRVWGGIEKEVKLGVQQDLVATIPRSSKKRLKAETQIDKQIKAPLEKGQVLGTLLVSLDGEEVARTELVALEAIEQAGLFSRLWDWALLQLENAAK